MAFSDGSADFRSDTVTRPTEEMRRAMAEAEVGDDVYHDDPTVNALEEEAAAVVGKEAAVFMPTGTMGNQIAVMLQTKPGDDVLADPGVHVRNVEAGGPAALSGVAFRTVDSTAGQVTPAQVEAAIAQAGFFPRIRLMIWENTHNLSGGRVVPHELMAETSATARRHGLAIHLDGARLFNAVVASGVSADSFAATADTVQFCFSKGLGAPVGSVLCGTEEMMGEARYLRKRMGGGMRQAGVIAAAGIVALQRMVDRLAEDHVNARTLAEGLAKLPGLRVDLATVQTNIVIVHVDGVGGRSGEALTQDLVQGCAGRKVKVHAMGPAAIRCVTHKDVDADDIARALEAFREITSRW
jgi:threonine aldolase